MSKLKRERPSWDHVDSMTSERGWFQPYLLAVDAMLWKRWQWWIERLAAGTVGSPDEHPIPQVPFAMSREPSPSWEACDPLPDRARDWFGTRAEAASHVERVFSKAMFQYFARASDLLEWWLWGFGSPRVERRPAIPEQAAVCMYHELEVQRLVANPTDWAAVIYQLENKKGAAWFPTPMSIVQLMVGMTFEDCKRAGEDARLKSVSDPCVGTGVMLLAASNYSLRLFGQDIDRSMVVACEWSGFLFAPWMVAPGESRIKEIAEANAKQLARAGANDAATTQELPATLDMHRPRPVKVTNQLALDFGE